MKYSYLIAALSTPTQAQDEFLMEVIFLENLLFFKGSSDPSHYIFGTMSERVGSEIQRL